MRNPSTICETKTNDLPRHLLKPSKRSYCDGRSHLVTRGVIADGFATRNGCAATARRTHSTLAGGSRSEAAHAEARSPSNRVRMQAADAGDVTKTPRADVAADAECSAVARQIHDTRALCERRRQPLDLTVGVTGTESTNAKLLPDTDCRSRPMPVVSATSAMFARVALARRSEAAVRGGGAFNLGTKTWDGSHAELPVPVRHQLTQMRDTLSGGRPSVFVGRNIYIPIGLRWRGAPGGFVLHVNALGQSRRFAFEA